MPDTTSYDVSCTGSKGHRFSVRYLFLSNIHFIHSFTFSILWSYHPSERALHAFQYSRLSLTYAWTILVSLASGHANPMDTTSPIASGNTAPRACFPWLPITLSLQTCPPTILPDCRQSLQRTLLGLQYISYSSFCHVFPIDHELIGTHGYSYIP
jgi:hypothetical protein